MDVAVGKMPKTLGAVRRKFAPWNDPSAAPLIRFESVTKRFGEVVAITDFSLDIYEREFFALLGPSGCAKTTLMRMLAGIGVTPEINAIRTLFIAFVTLMVIIASIATKRREIGARRAARAGL